MRQRGTRILAAAAIAFASLGCGSMLTEAAERMTPAVVRGAVEGLADEETQRRMVNAVDEERVQAVSARLSAGMLDGMLDTLEDPTRKKRLEAIVVGLAASASGAAVDSMLDRALDDAIQKRMRGTMRAYVGELVAVIIETVDAHSDSPEKRTASLGASAREIVKQATLGFQEALDDTRRDRADGSMPKADGALLIAAGNASATGTRIVWILGIGFVALALGLGITLTWAIRKSRMRRNELQQRDSALLLLTEAITSTATLPGSQELHTVLKTAMRDRAGGEHFLKVLGEQGRTLLGIDKTT